MASVADAPTLPVSLRAVESVLLTVSAVAWTMSPPPLTAVTILIFYRLHYPRVLGLHVCSPFVLPRLVAGWCIPAPADSDPMVVLLFLGFFNGHVVDHAFHSVDVPDKFGDQVLLGVVFGRATQSDHALGRRKRGGEKDGRTKTQ